MPDFDQFLCARALRVCLKQMYFGVYYLNAPDRRLAEDILSESTRQGFGATPRVHAAALLKLH